MDGPVEPAPNAEAHRFGGELALFVDECVDAAPQLLVGEMGQKTTAHAGQVHALRPAERMSQSATSMAPMARKVVWRFLCHMD